MTERDLREKILLIIYKNRDIENIEIDDLCRDNSITFSSEQQKIRIFEALEKSGYIDALFYGMSQGIIKNITSKGIDKAEELLAKSLKETERLVKDGNFKIDIPEPKILQDEKNDSGTKSVIFKPQEIKQNIKDKKISACFGVEALASCFLKQLDSAVNTNMDNVCMIGIFAPWGRGKSYFFERVKEQIESKTKQNDIKYNVIEFNAWKYQETPAIWAYLFETIYKKTTWWIKLISFLYTKHTLITMLFLIISTIILFYLKYLNVTLTLMSGGLSFGFIVNYLYENYNSAISIIKKYGARISFSNELGIQAEIEKELAFLLKCWICKKKISSKKVLLYVDDIDRCSETKMISIIDSLRTILENDEIRKRLIIVCSIDSDKLMKGIEHKYEYLYQTESKKMTIEQMDKIFLTGIALPKLDNDQLHEFVSKLTDNERNEENGMSISPLNVSRENGSLFATTPSTKEQECNPKNISEFINGKIDASDVQLTPRRIRVIYNRMIFADNIITACKEIQLIPQEIFEKIFDLSCNKECSSELKSALEDVIEMVVPYSLNKLKQNEDNAKSVSESN